MGYKKGLCKYLYNKIGVSSQKLKEKNIKLNSLIFDKTIYENGPKIVVIGAGSRSWYIS